MVTPTQKSGSDRRARRALLWLGTGMLLALASGCTITRTTTPAPPGTQISRIYVQRNEAILMKELHDEIIAQLAELGVDAQTTTGPRPPEAVHLLTYTANWRWDFAMVLTYFQATLLENQRILGRVEYDARQGVGRVEKFGKTSEKIRPLLQELLQNVEKIPPPPNPLLTPDVVRPIEELAPPPLESPSEAEAESATVP